MIHIISTGLLIAGVLLFIIGVLVFMLSDCRAVLKDLSTTRQLELDNGIDAVAQEAYYNSSLVPYMDEPEKPKVKKGFRRKNAEETDVLRSTSSTRDETGPAPLSYKTPSADKKAHVNSETIPKGQTEPLSTLRSILAETDTEPLVAGASSENGTQPLTKEGTQPLAADRSPAERGTEPLKENMQGSTEPLKEMTGTQPLSQNRGTQPLKGFSRH